uniref:Uncharacterized protein n=1 Tax=Rhipicephalus microplus TaxID=6941 RepID=A0A6G5AHX0_RHIMP
MEMLAYSPPASTHDRDTLPRLYEVPCHSMRVHMLTLYAFWKHFLYSCFVTLLKCLYTVLIFYFQNFLCIFIFIGNDLRHAVQRIQLGWCSCWFCTQNVNMQFCCLKPCVFMLPLHILQHNYCIQFIHLHGTTKSYTPLCCFR